MIVRSKSEAMNQPVAPGLHSDGKTRRLTDGQLNRTILAVSAPMIGEMILESSFAITDIFWVGKLGPAAVSVVGCTEAIVSIVLTLGVGLSVGTTAMVARRSGEGDHPSAEIAASQAMYLGVLLSICLGILGWLCAPRLLGYMGAPSPLVRSGSAYARLALGGSGAVILLFLNNAIFRSAGDAFIAMKVLLVANVINGLLAPLLIFGIGPFPRCGITGAALTTVVARSTGVIYQFYCMIRGAGRFRIKQWSLRPHFLVMWRLARMSSSGALQFLIANLSWLVLVRIAAFFGSTAIAAYTIASRVSMFLVLPSWGLSNAAAALVGQNMGAGNAHNAEMTVWRIGAWNTVILGCTGVALYVLATPVAEIFVHDPAAVQLTSSALRIFSFGNLASAYGMVMPQAFNGAGDTLMPLMLNICGFWLLELPLAWWLSIHTRWGVEGMFIAIVIAEMLIAITSVILFRRGRWKEAVV